jgi:hypothetical protein
MRYGESILYKDHEGRKFSKRRGRSCRLKLAIIKISVPGSRLTDTGWMRYIFAPCV